MFGHWLVIQWYRMLDHQPPTPLPHYTAIHTDKSETSTHLGRTKKNNWVISGVNRILCPYVLFSSYTTQSVHWARSLLNNCLQILCCNTVYSGAFSLSIFTLSSEALGFYLFFCVQLTLSLPRKWCLTAPGTQWISVIKKTTNKIIL